MKQSIAQLAALAQESRLSAFRLLVRAGDEGLPAGQIAELLGVPHNTLSTHLATLERSDLVRAERDGRRIIYRANFAGMRALLAFLLKDCCQGAPAPCDRALASLPDTCCPPSKT